MKKKILENFVKYTLIILLIYNFFSSVFVILVNPESYFFGKRLTGVNAIIYLLIRDITGIGIVYYLFKKKSKVEILSLIYFGYFFVESLITNLSLGLGFSVSPLPNFGLVVSIILLVLRKMIYR